MIEDIKRDIKTLIENNVMELANRVFAAYPEKNADFPCCCLDSVSMVGDIRIGAEIRSHLVRISVFADDRLELDQLVDKILNVFKDHSGELAKCYYNGISSISPTVFAFEDREDRWRRDIDVKVLAVLKK